MIGWIGLGGMGLPMARNVVQAGIGLTVCDLRPEPVADLAELGAATGRDPSEVAAASDVVFVSLPHESVSRAVAAEVFAADTPPDVYVELSTLSPTTMRDLAAQAAAAGVAFCDSPVSGGVRARNEGDLAVMVGGPDDAYTRIRPVLDAIGSHVFHLGEVGAGSVAKIANNLVALTSMVTAIEGLLLGSAHGLDLQQLRDVIMVSSGSSPQILGAAHQHRTRRYRESTTPQAALRLASKDLALAVDLAADVGLPVVTARAALGQWQAAERAGLGEAELWFLLDHLEQTLSREPEAR